MKMSTGADVVDLSPRRLYRHIERIIYAPHANLQIELSHGTNRLSAPREFGGALLDGMRRKDLVSEYSAPEGPPVLREAIAFYESSSAAGSVRPTNVIVTHGGTEAMTLVWRFLVSRRQMKLLVLGPSFPSVFATAEAAQMVVKLALGPAQHGCELSIDEMIEAVDRERPDAAVISQPSNPAGHVLPTSDMNQLMEAAVRSGCAIVLDKVGGDIGSPSFPPLPHYWHLAKTWNVESFLIDSFSKRRGIPGLRFGYLVAGKNCIQWCAESLFGRSVSTVPTHAVVNDLLWTQPWSTEAASSPTPTAYIREIWANHAICANNREQLLTALGRWIIHSSACVSGMNSTVTLSFGSAATDLQRMQNLITNDGIATYPVSCFVPGRGYRSRKEFAVRVTASTPSNEFSKVIEKLVEVLTRSCAF